MTAQTIADPQSFIRANTRLRSVPLVPEIVVFLADESLPLWQLTENELNEAGLPPPFWAFAWAGGQALARYVLDHPETVRDRRVLDIASGSGLVGIAHARASFSLHRCHPRPDQGRQSVRINAFRPSFGDFIPKTLEDGVLYISRRFSTASHRCACGCGTKIVTPIRETDYKLTERDGLVSLTSSIGNWDHPCQSHYWIRDNKVMWAGAMSKQAIRAGRMHDDADREAYFAQVAWPWWRRLARSLADWWSRMFG